VGSGAKKRGRRIRSGRRGRRTDITRGVEISATGPTYDPPWRSISEGRGLPRTPIYRAMTPVVIVCVVAMLALVIVGASLSALLD
jgi:hypothetical protein